MANGSKFFEPVSTKAIPVDLQQVQIPESEKEQELKYTRKSLGLADATSYEILSAFREKYPELKDTEDYELAQALETKYRARPGFAKRTGIKALRHFYESGEGIQKLIAPEYDSETKEKYTKALQTLSDIKPSFRDEKYYIPEAEKGSEKLADTLGSLIGEIPFMVGAGGVGKQAVSRLGLQGTKNLAAREAIAGGLFAQTKQYDNVKDRLLGTAGEAALWSGMSVVGSKIWNKLKPKQKQLVTATVDQIDKTGEAPKKVVASLEDQLKPIFGDEAKQVADDIVRITKENIKPYEPPIISLSKFNKDTPLVKQMIKAGFDDPVKAADELADIALRNEQNYSKAVDRLAEYLKKIGFSDAKGAADDLLKQMQQNSPASYVDNFVPEKLKTEVGEKTVEAIKKATTEDIKAIPKESKEQFVKRIISQKQTQDPLLEEAGGIIKEWAKKPGNNWEAVKYLDTDVMAGAKGELPKGYKPLTDPDAQRVWQVGEMGRLEFELQRMTKVKDVIGFLKRQFWDRAGNVSKELKKYGEIGQVAEDRFRLIAGSHPNAKRILDDAYKKIYKDTGLDIADKEVLNQFNKARRSLAISEYKPNFKFEKGTSPKQYQAFLDNLKATNPDKFAKLQKASDEFQKVTQSQLDELLKNGLLTPKDHANLSKHFYSPREIINKIDPIYNYQFSGKSAPLSIHDSGIKKLEEGSLKAIENDAELLLEHVVASTQGRIFKNRANQSLLDVARNVKDNQLVQELPKKWFYKPERNQAIKKLQNEFAQKANKLIAFGDDQGINKLKQEMRTRLKQINQDYLTYDYGKIPYGHQLIEARVGGETFGMAMPDKMAQEWVAYDPVINSTTAKIFQKLSGAPVLKAMATGYNPEFAVRNTVRDMAHIFMTTNVYSPHAPIAFGQMGKDIAKVITNKSFRKNLLDDFIKHGGGLELLSHQGRVSGKFKGALGKIEKIAGYLGEFSETMTRISLYDRALKQGLKQGFSRERAAEHAAAIARGYLDFHQGGLAIKFADKGMPYINAAVQGTRGIARAIKERPMQTAYKMSQLGLFAGMLYGANRHVNKEGWEQVHEREKANNFIFMLPKAFSYEDKNGNVKHRYIKIAKDQGQQLVTALFENVAAKMHGDQVNYKQIAQGAEQLSSIPDISSLPPTLKMVFTYMGNTDVWNWEKVWRGKDVEPEAEVTPYTGKAFYHLGQKTGLSPVRMQKTAEQMFTRGNLWTSMLGAPINAVLKNVPELQQKNVKEELVNNLPFVRKATSSTNPYASVYKETEKISRAENTRQQKQNLRFDALTSKYLKDKTESNKKSIQSFIKNQPVTDRQRLITRFKRTERFYGVPNRRWWIDLSYMGPEARAQAFYKRYEKANDKEKDILKKNLFKIKGIASDRFKREFNRLRRENTK